LEGFIPHHVMFRRLPNYLRTFRKRAGLSQKDVALLLGCTNESKASRYERFVREPTLVTALACEALFGIPLSELFAGIYDEAYEAVVTRARLLIEQIEKQPRSGLVRRRQFLQALLSKSNPQSQP
jgi:transcriptional regulator with XRE-family HTH domain